MKKVLFLIDNLKGGGAEKAIKIIVEGLTSQGYEPILVLLENQFDYKLDANVKLYSLSEKINKFNFVFLLFKFIKLLRVINPDIIYSTNTKAQILSLLSEPFFKSKRVVNIQVDLTKQYEGREYIFNFYNRLLKFADAYSFISRGIYENLKDKIPEKENIFIPNPIDFEEIDKLKKEEIEEKYKSIFSKKTFITIGRLTEQKGQWDLLDGFRKMDKDCHLIILGAGEKEKELKELSKEYNIENKVFFLGFQTNPFKFLYNSDVFVLSSLWEGFGNVIVEAMRCELPIISTDCPSGPREIIAPQSDICYKLKDKIEVSDYGILVPVSNPVELCNAMESLLLDQNSLLNYKEKSIERAENYGKEKIVHDFIEKIIE